MSEIDEKDGPLSQAFANGVKKDKEILKLWTVIRDVKHKMGLDIELELDSEKIDEMITYLNASIGFKNAYIFKLRDELDRLKNMNRDVEEQPDICDLHKHVGDLQKELDAGVRTIENLYLQQKRAAEVDALIDSVAPKQI